MPPSGNTPGSLEFGMVVMVLIQLGHIFFAWKKSTAATENVRKADLDRVKAELMQNIEKAEVRGKERCDGLDEDLRLIRRDSQVWRMGVDEKLSKIERATSSESGSNRQALEFIKQKLISLDTKVDHLAERKADKTSHKE